MRRLFRIACLTALICFVWGLAAPAYGSSSVGERTSAHMTDAAAAGAGEPAVQETPGEKKSAKKFPWLLAGLGVVAVVTAIVLLTGKKDNPNNGGNNGNIEYGTVTDIDGNVYRTVKIGSQWWMAENLKARHAADGSLLAGAYAYNDNENNVSTYGRLYDWHTARTPTIPGWHLPSLGEWETLTQFIGEANAGTLLKQGGRTGFNALFGGSRFYDGSYNSIGVRGHYWSSNAYTDDHAHIVNFFPDEPAVPRSGYGMVGAISVRLVKD